MDPETPLPGQFRRKLPARRASQNLNFSVMNNDYVASIGYYPDGRIGDVFVRSGKAGSHSSILLLEASIALSVAFQFGARAEDMRRAMPHVSRVGDKALGEPEGPIGTLLTILAKEEERYVKERLDD